MIIYILLGFLIFISFINFLFLMGINNSLIKFYNFFKEESSKELPQINKLNVNNQKGLVDINSVGTYDARFNNKQR